MRLDLDSDYILSCMRLWRETVDLQVPNMRDDIKMHMMVQRVRILSGFENVASAWLMALRRAVPDADSKTEFDSLIQEILAFETWAKAELATISGMANLEAAQSGIEDLLSDPKAAAALRELVKKMRPPDADSA